MALHRREYRHISHNSIAFGSVPINDIRDIRNNGEYG
jgi:hypothetical protein